MLEDGDADRFAHVQKSQRFVAIPANAPVPNQPTRPARPEVPQPPFCPLRRITETEAFGTLSADIQLALVRVLDSVEEAQVTPSTALASTGFPAGTSEIDGPNRHPTGFVAAIFFRGLCAFSGRIRYN
jgi:hypothetical protein